jgi:hypothetical protein
LKYTTILTHSQPHSAIHDHNLPYWAILGHISPYSIIVSPIWTYSATLGHTCYARPYWAMLRHTHIYYNIYIKHPTLLVFQTSRSFFKRQTFKLIGLHSHLSRRIRDLLPICLIPYMHIMDRLIVALQLHDLILNMSVSSDILLIHKSIIISFYYISALRFTLRWL